MLFFFKHLLLFFFHFRIFFGYRNYENSAWVTMKFTVCLQIFKTSKISWNWMYPGMVSDFFYYYSVFNHFAVLCLEIMIENLIFIVSIDVNIFFRCFFPSFFRLFSFLYGWSTNSFYLQLQMKHVYMWTTVNESCESKV